MEINGWTLFGHPEFHDQIETLTAKVEALKRKAPETYQTHANTKVLAAIGKLAFDIIPQDPTRGQYRLGDTLGADRKHWFRAKFGNGRFRLFYRFGTSAKVIIFAWVFDETTLRTYG